MLSKILAAMAALAMIAALWYRSEAVQAGAELQRANERAASWKSAAEAIAKNSTKSDAVVTVRRQVADRRKEELSHEAAKDRQVLVENQDWAVQPIPAGVIERLRTGAAGKD